MSQQPIEASTSWGGRAEALRRTGMAVLGALAFATVVPAIANAAGADLPNPVYFALRNAGEALSGDETCETPEVTPTDVPSDAPTDTPTDAPSEVPSEAPAECEDEDGDDDGGEPSESPEAEPTESEAPEVDDGDGNHGKIVSTVAKCTPRGKDPLFETLGDDLRNHGSFVKAAAHGDTLTTPWGSFDLSTQAGADALCAAVELARADLAAASPEADADKADKAKGKGKGKGKGKKKPAGTSGD